MKKKTLQKSILCAALLLSAAVLAGCYEKEGSKTAEGIAEVEAGHYDEAMSLFDQAGGAGEEMVYIKRGIGLCYMGQNKYEEAIEAFKEALAADGSVPGSVDYDMNYYLGICYYKLGQYEDSKARFDAILDLKEKSADAHLERGCVELAMGSHDEAIADFDRAVELEPKDYGLLIDIYCILRESGREDEGSEYLKAAVESGDRKMSDYDRGRLYFYLEDYSNARDYLEKAKGNKNTSEELIILLGQCYENLNDRTYALTVYQSYLAGSQSRAVYNQMGMCYAAAGDYESALTAFQTALALSDASYDKELRFNEIVTYEKLGDAATAKELCASFVKDYPEDEAGIREYQFLKTR